MLLESLSSPETAAAAARVQAAVSELDTGDADVVVVVSPHGARTGVYDSAFGSLKGFGFPDVGADLEGSQTAVDTLVSAGLERIRGPIDHGVLVPAMLLRPRPPLVGIALEEREPGDPATRADAASVVESIGGVSDVTAFVVASVNTSAALSPRAPLTELEAAKDAEEGFLEAFARDVDCRDAIERLASAGRSCSAGPLFVLGSLFSGRGAEVIVREAPVGVGYPVATIA